MLSISPALKHLNELDEVNNCMQSSSFVHSETFKYIDAEVKFMLINFTAEPGKQQMFSLLTYVNAFPFLLQEKRSVSFLF